MAIFYNWLALRSADSAAEARTSRRVVDEG